MKRNINFVGRKIRKLNLKSKPTRKLYRKFDQSISPAGASKYDELVKSVKENPNLNAKNFHQTLDKETKKIFPRLTVEEFDVAKFVALQKLLDKWEEELQDVGDDAQLGNIDMQNMLEKQQQTIQTLSNVSKMLHDTSMAIIRKIG
ncbi:MAG: hypothetical protein KGD67_01305 [Candidatus Lokiarchaeota archaeon]|nr:hypothetical protein [Candidatus Lokiarchaeota archaeon]